MFETASHLEVDRVMDSMGTRTLVLKAL